MLTAPCLSRLRCDQLLNGELADAADALEHAAGCPRCTARLAEHRRERAAFAVPRRQPRRWIAGAVALAAVAALVLAIPRSETTRSKGRPVLGFYLKRGDAIHRGGDGEQVAPGDVLDFTVASEAPTFVAIISVDGARQVTAYYPAGPHAAAVGPGEQVLPLAVRLDGVLGIESVHGLFCDRPALVAELAAAIARGATPAGCVDDTLTIEKR